MPFCHVFGSSVELEEANFDVVFSDDNSLGNGFNDLSLFLMRQRVPAGSQIARLTDCFFTGRPYTRPRCP